MPCRVDADNDAADDIDGENDDAGDGVAAHEFRRAVHGAEEGALLLQLAPARLRLLVVDEAGGKIGVDRHLLAGNGVERESGADLGDARGALGDDEKIDRDENQKDDEADDEIAAHHEAGKAADDVAGRRHALRAMRQDEPGRRQIERQPQQRRHQQHRRKRREFQRLADPQRHHQDDDGQGDRQRQPDIDQRRRHRQEEDAENEDDGRGESHVAPVALRRALDQCQRCLAHPRLPFRDDPVARGWREASGSEAALDMRVESFGEGEDLRRDERRAEA
jgi:hypothetical protein